MAVPGMPVPVSVMSFRVTVLVMAVLIMAVLVMAVLVLDVFVGVVHASSIPSEGNHEQATSSLRTPAQPWSRLDHMP
jgi:hypothetical protein